MQKVKIFINLTSKADYLENQSRRKNIFVDGISQSVNEKWVETEKNFREIITEKCLSITDRQGESLTIVMNHPVVVEFLRHVDKQAVLAEAKSLKETNIFIKEDYSEAVVKRVKTFGTMYIHFHSQATKK